MKIRNTLVGGGLGSGDSVELIGMLHNWLDVGLPSPYRVEFIWLVLQTNGILQKCYKK